MKFRSVFIVFFVISIGNMSLVSANNVKEDNGIVAIVEDSSIIFYKSIRIKRDDRILSVFFPDYKGMKESEKEGFILKIEKNILTRIIKYHVLQKAMRDMNLHLNDEEFYKRLDEMFVKSGLSEEKIKQQYKRSNAIANAVELMGNNFNNKDKQEKLYKSKLSFLGISNEEWNDVINLIKETGDTRSFVKRSIPKDINEIRQMYYKDILIRDRFQLDKLEEIISADVQDVTEQEIKKYYDEKYKPYFTKPEYKEIRDEIYKELLFKKKSNAKKEWWKEIVKKTKIEIKDNRFIGVLTEISNAYPFRKIERDLFKSDKSKK